MRIMQILSIWLVAFAHTFKILDFFFFFFQIFELFRFYFLSITLSNMPKIALKKMFLLSYSVDFFQ